MTTVEWQRLFNIAPENIKELLATKESFSPTITPVLEKIGGLDVLYTFNFKLITLAWIKLINIGQSILKFQPNIVQL
jgi:hypothetical protein